LSVPHDGGFRTSFSAPEIEARDVTGAFLKKNGFVNLGPTRCESLAWRKSAELSILETDRGCGQGDGYLVFTSDLAAIYMPGAAPGDFAK
jgi:hypothetical protein